MNLTRGKPPLRWQGRLSLRHSPLPPVGQWLNPLGQIFLTFWPPMPKTSCQKRLPQKQLKPLRPALHLALLHRQVLHLLRVHHPALILVAMVKETAKNANASSDRDTRIPNRTVVQFPPGFLPAELSFTGRMSALNQLGN